VGIAITADHRELADVVRAFLDRRQARSAARALLDSETEQRPEMWQELAELGWLGLHIPEEFGGSGYGLPELVVVAEEFGRAVAPGPLLPTVIASATIAAHAGRDDQARLLPGLVDGTLTAAVGVAGDLTISDGALSGEAVVLGAAGASFFQLIVGDDVVIMPAGTPGVDVEIPTGLDPTRRAGRLKLHAIPLSHATMLLGSATTALALARTLIAAEAVGGAHDCLDAALAYAKVRQQFGRTIGTFQAVKHHLANMLVAAEAALSTVWDAARAAGTDTGEFELMAACAATLALPAYVSNAELNIQIHGGIGYTWEHDAHLHLRRSAALRALFGGSGAPTDVFELAASGTVRHNAIDLPPHAEQLRTEVRAEVSGWVQLQPDQRRERMIESGYLVPHWPKPWGRAADAVEQLVIEQELAAADIRRPDLAISGWVVLTLIQHGNPDQIERFVRPALRGEQIWCQLFSEPGAGSDAAAVSTKGTRVEGGWLISGQKVWTSLAQECHVGLATVRTDPSAPKHAGITTMVVDMHAAGVDVRPLRQITGGAEFNEVFLTDVFVPDADVVGEPNNGWAVARATLGNERVSIGAGRDGADSAVDALIKITQRHGQRVGGATERTGRCLAEGHAVRLLNLRRAARSVAGAEPGPEGNVTKLLLSEHTANRSALVAELLGPQVALASGPAKAAATMILASRAYAIAGGTSEITRNQIAERILGLPRDPLIS
jgi:alkylation response protein AidB-like acyl-CoA dehydrogenase